MARGKATVTVKDNGDRKLLRELKKLSGMTISVGVHADAGAHHDASGDSGDMITVAELAGWHEFGSGATPQRSFLRSTFDENRPKLERLMADEFEEVIKTGGQHTASKAARNIGREFQKLVKSKIKNRIPPPIVYETEEERIRKGYDPNAPPLLASRQLFRSIKVKLKK